MAKSRYSIGPLSVGQLQYDSVMAPTCLVEVDEEAPGNLVPDETTPAANKTTETGLAPSTVFRVFRPTYSVRTDTKCVFLLTNCRTYLQMFALWL